MTSVLLLALSLTACGGGESSSDSGSARNTNTNAIPIAKAGDDVITEAGFEVVLDGTSSSDPDGDQLSYEWTQTAGDPVTLSSTDTAITSFVAPMVAQESSYEFELTASDTKTTGKDKVRVSVKPSSDTTAPQLIVRTPTAGATNVAVDTTVTATFDERLADATVTDANFVLSSANGNVAASISYSKPDNRITLTPAAVLANNTLYTATLSSGLTDRAGNPFAGSVWSFTTEAGVVIGDTTAPSLISNNPSSGATGVARTVSIQASFSESLNAATVNGSSVQLSSSLGVVSATVSYSDASRSVTLTPGSDLAYETTYTVTLGNQIKDLAGNAFAGASWSFTTELAPVGDVTPPTITSRSPAPGATAVAISSAVSATFSESLKAATVNSASVSLSGPQGAVSGSVGYHNGSKTVSFTPAAALAHATTYTVTLNSLITDSADNSFAGSSWSFTTVDAPVVDTTAPAITARTPAANASNVAIDTAINATFNEALNASTVNGSSVQLSGPQGAVSATVSYSSTSKLISVAPTANLAHATSYTVTMNSQITDSAGNNFAGSSWSFTTVDAPDTTAPTITSRTPLAGASSVAVNGSISATFSEALNGATITTSSVQLSGAQGVVAGSVSYSSANKTVTFMPNADLANDTVYTATLTSQITDSAGNQFAGSSWSFTTVAGVVLDTTAPSLVSKFPAAGATSVSNNVVVSASFDEALDPTTITNQTVVLSDDIGAINGTASYDSANMAILFTPAAELDPQITYTITLSGGISDLAGNSFAGTSWSFTTSGGGLANRTAADVCGRWNSDHPEQATTIWTPGVNQCDTGTLSEAAHADAMRRLNLWRWLVGVNDVSVDQAQRQAEMEATTMMAENNLFSHTGWTANHACYTDAAKYAVAGSNIGFGYSSPAASVDAYIFDRGVTSLGHRRRALAYRLSTTAFGKHSDYDAMYIYDFDNAITAPEYIAYPSPGPFPKEALLAWSYIYQTWEMKTPWSFAAEPLDATTTVTITKQPGNINVPLSVYFYGGSSTRMPMVTIIPDSTYLEPGASYDVAVQSGANNWQYTTSINDCAQ